MWSLTTDPTGAGRHLREAELLPSLAIPFAAFVVVCAIDIPAFVVLKIDTEQNVLEAVPALAGAWLFLWVVPFTLGEWLVLALLGHRAPLGRAFAVSCLSAAPLLVAGLFPVLGLFIAMPAMFAVRVGLVRGTTSAPRIETGVSVLAPVVMLALWLFALRIDVVFHTP